MKITEIPFASLRLQYRIARMPLRLFEQRVLVRVDSEAPARLLYERSVGAVDSVVGNMLGDTEVEKQGAARVERSEALGEATRLDELATPAASAPGKARATSQRRVRAARSTAEERKRQGTQTAAKRAAEVKQRVDEAAAAKVIGVETAKRANQQRITAAERSATAVAEAELDDAAEKRSEAIAKRAHADRVDDLAAAEKAERRAQQGR